MFYEKGEEDEKEARLEWERSINILWINLTCLLLTLMLLLAFSILFFHRLIKIADSSLQGRHNKAKRDREWKSKAIFTAKKVFMSALYSIAFFYFRFQQSSRETPTYLEANKFISHPRADWNGLKIYFYVFLVDTFAAVCFFCSKLKSGFLARLKIRSSWHLKINSKKFE